MSGRGSRFGPASFAQLARLQQLAVLAQRRELEQACAETDRRDLLSQDLVADLDRAEQGYAAAHTGGRICLSRLTVAAAIVNASEDALRAGHAALGQARSEEDAASTAWLQSRYRAEWFADRDRDHRRYETARRADRADVEARTLRLSRDRGPA